MGRRTSRPLPNPSNPANTASRADQVYMTVKRDIFDFRLLPGDNFTESQVAERMEVSRTPVREALFRLERDGYLQVHFRSGWSVKQIADFNGDGKGDIVWQHSGGGSAMVTAGTAVVSGPGAGGGRDAAGAPPHAATVVMNNRAGRTVSQ